VILIVYFSFLKFTAYNKAEAGASPINSNTSCLSWMFVFAYSKSRLKDSSTYNNNNNNNNIKESGNVKLQNIFHGRSNITCTYHKL